MRNKMTKAELDNLLFPYAAKVSFKDAVSQCKSDGYVGDEFKEDKRPVYNFSVVSIQGEIDWANTNSPIYQKIPRDIVKIFFNCYIETQQRIYV